MRGRGTIGGLALLALVSQSGCGGGGGSSQGGGSNGMTGITWPTREGTPTTMLPPAVQTGRVVFESESGESCCVAVDPAILGGSSRGGLAILTDLAPGPATVTVAGFTTNFAPTVPGILTTCTTMPANAAHPCDPLLVAAPAFESAPLHVTIVAGAQTNLPEVPMVGLPFLYDFSPAQDSVAPAPVQFDLTVVDPVTGIKHDSVELEVSFTVPNEPAQAGTNPSPFRSLSKRVPLDLTVCADGSPVPCSGSGNLQLAGFLANGKAPELPVGTVQAHVTAENLGDPPQQLDFRYSFDVLATVTATGTATPRPDATAAVGAAPAAPAAIATPAGSTGGSPAGSADGPSAAANGAGGGDSAAAAGIPPTPTATPTP